MGFFLAGHVIEVAEEAHGVAALVRDHGPGHDLRRRILHQVGIQDHRCRMEEAG